VEIALSTAREIIGRKHFCYAQAYPARCRLRRRSCELIVLFQVSPVDPSGFFS
jgi:hypothetical protein